MAKIYNNDKKFLIIQLDNKEATELGFGVQITALTNVCVCGSCNKELNPDMYYVAAINEVLCEDCMLDYIKHMNHYCDDDSLIYEVNHFNKIAEQLNIKEKASITHDSKIILYDKEKVKEHFASY